MNMLTANKTFRNFGIGALVCLASCADTGKVNEDLSEKCLIRRGYIMSEINHAFVDGLYIGKSGSLNYHKQVIEYVASAKISDEKKLEYLDGVGKDIEILRQADEISKRMKKIPIIEDRKIETRRAI